MKADLHIHSIYSPGGITKPETVLEIAAERGIDIIAVTDYNSVKSQRAFLKIAKDYPVEIVFGQEIKLTNGKYIDGELLALFLQAPIKSTLVEDIITEVTAQNGLISIAHPFCHRQGEFRAFDRIENWSNIAIEARNGRTFKRRDNYMAEEFAQRLSLPITAGSDAHTPFEIGNVYLEFDGKNASDLKSAILHRDVAIRGEASSAIFTLLSTLDKLGITL